MSIIYFYELHFESLNCSECKTEVPCYGGNSNCIKYSMHSGGRERKKTHVAYHVSLPWNSTELSTRGHANFCAYKFKKPKNKTISRIPITIYFTWIVFILYEAEMIFKLLAKFEYSSKKLKDKGSLDYHWSINLPLLTFNKMHWLLFMW